jgi:putative hemolysin
MMYILIISSAVAVVISFLCSLAETLLLTLNPLSLHHLEQTHPRAAKSWRLLKRNIAHPITAILVLNTVAHTGGATVAGGAFAEIYGEGNIWIFSLLFTLIVLLGTELLPKIIGVTFKNQLAPRAGPILACVTTALHPFVLLSEVIFKRLMSEPESEQITSSDLVTLATMARAGKAIDSDQENMIANVVRLTHSRISLAMIPQEQVHFIGPSDNAETILALARQHGHTRYPVSRSAEAKDIFACIQIKRAILASEQEVERLRARPNPLHTVNQRDTLMVALHSMLQNKEHLLSVVDDRSRCVGIVTLEDIASELLGADIEDFR